ncbi:MAG: VPS10 domain-containing protein [Gemmatimonadales bacterium]
MVGALLTSPGFAQAPRASQAAAPEVSAFAALSYRHIGPRGNRVSAVAGVPGDPMVYYAGAASGGIWKTSDGGITWDPIFDSQPVQSIGTLAVAPSNPQVVWAGTGEPHIRSHISVGWGVYKSTDAGRTWTRKGLENTGRISRIVIHPTNPNVVLVASQGHGYGPQRERGVFRSTDGGDTWQPVLFVDENTGASDIVMDPNDPNVLFAGMWQYVIKTWGRESGGPGSGIYLSRDGGVTWRRLSGNGLPTRPFGKVALAIAKTNSKRIYALIEAGDGVPWKGQPTDRGKLWRSDDGGERWEIVSYDRQLGGRSAYYNELFVSPDNPEEVYFLTAAFSKSLDGGRSLANLGFGASPGGDNHEMWIDPTDGDRMAVANDNAIAISVNRGRTWNRVQLPIAQMYHVTVDDRVPYTVCGNRQDGPSACGPSNSKLGGFGGGGGGGGGGGPIPRSLWHGVGGGESGWATPDPADSNIIWSSASGSGSRGGIVTRWDRRTGVSRNVEVWPVSTGGWPAADLRYRFVWTFPLTFSPHDPKRMYVGSQHVHVTTNGGESWQELSPDLTRNDKSRMGISGGLTPDNIGVEYGGVLFAIAESRVTPGVIWAGSNDGLVHVTRDGGKGWTNVTSNLPGLIDWGTISNIEPSRYDAGTAYLTVDGHQVDNRDPWVYQTTDYGRTWKLIVNGIPKSPLSYAHWIKEDPVRRGLLYVGTENALYVSFDDGERWQRLQNNLPHAPVYGIAVQEHFNDLVIATYGRGFWILDDLSPLQQLTWEVAAQDAHLFKPRLAYRFLSATAPEAVPGDPSVGQNPPYGATINYWLRTAPSSDPTITILDSQGAVVKTIRGSRTAGVNRMRWDLRYEQTQNARLRVHPLYAPEIRIPPEGMPAPSVGSMAILAPPGRYTVKLSVGGREFTQPLEVRKDPNSGGSLEGIRAQIAFLFEIQKSLVNAVGMIDTMQLHRARLAEVRSTLSAPANRDLASAADSLEQKIIAVEDKIHQLKTTGRGQDGVRWPVKLAGQLVYVAGTAAGSDEPPTTQARAAFHHLDDQVQAVRREYQRVMAEAEAYQARLRARNIISEQ